MNESEKFPSIHEAVDNLATLSDFDLEHPSSIGMTRNKFVTEGDVLPEGAIQWFSPENIEDIVESLKKTYHTVFEYLKKIYQDETFEWKKKKVRQGIQEIMELVGKSKDFTDSYIDSVKHIVQVEKIQNSSEFQLLMKFYLEKIQKKFDTPLEGKGDWEEVWKSNQNASLLDLEKSGLKDFDTVKSDAEYELFYLKNGDGHPFFQKELLRSIELYTDFDNSEKVDEKDPLLRIISFVDRNQMGISNQILHNIYPLLQDFYQHQKKEEDKGFYYAVNQMIMALMLASNNKNLIQNTTGKNASQYFSDFQYFLNQVLISKNYKESLFKGTPFSVIVLEVIHLVCSSLFNNKGAIKEEMMGFIHRLISLSTQDKKVKLQKEDTVWSVLLKEDESIRNVLAQYPNGPMFKILDVIREKTNGFYPLLQNNLPKYLYNFSFLEKKVEILKIPSPTKQLMISEAEIADEFLGFLRMYKTKNQNKKHLMILLQDRTSWKEHARTKVIEGLGKNSDLKGCISIITLPKDTDFYYQNESYIHMNKAEDFLRTFKEQLLSPEDFGFYFPPFFDNDDFSTFISNAIDTIHAVFFEKRTMLSQRERQDFIEIFYHFCILKVIERVQPNTLSFTCKDALDVGGVVNFSFFSFIHVLERKQIKKRDLDFMLYLLYTEPLIVRERSVNIQRLNRALCFISFMDKMLEEDTKNKLIVLSTLFSPNLLKSINIIH